MSPARLQLTVALACVAVAGGAAQQVQTPTRDTTAAAAQPTGTGVIRGTVVNADADARPMRLAKVTLNSNALRRLPVVMTDDAGRFEFRQLPAGRFTVQASKPGYLQASYGQKRPDGPGLPIMLADGQQMDITIRVPRGGVITGTIRGPGGEPAPGVQVNALVYNDPTAPDRKLGNRTFSNSGNGSLTTDDRGVYRIYGLPPGEYYLMAQPLTSPLGGQTVSTAELDWAQRLLAAPGAPIVPAPPAGQAATFSAVLYPGTTDLAAAEGITLSAEEERSGIDLTLNYVPTATVSGVVLDMDGHPPRVSQLTLIRPNVPFGMRTGGGFMRADAEGKFSATGITPGDYILAARGAGHDAEVTAAGPQGDASQPLWAMMELHVNGRDMTGLELKLAPGINVSGRIVFDGTAKPPADLSKLTVSMAAQDQTSLGSPPANAKADGTFAIPGVGPGRYRLFATVPTTQGPAVWTLKSATVHGVDSQDTPFDIARDDVTDAVITFTDHPAELTGVLSDASGRAAIEYFILVVSTDRSTWSSQSRRIRAVRPSNNGNFSISGLPAGEYYVLALTDLEQSRMYSPSYLDPLVASAQIKLTFADGEKKTQDFRIK
jgi:protocatechuate 3,4-dioxygenase beta subunit